MAILSVMMFFGSVAVKMITLFARRLYTSSRRIGRWLPRGVVGLTVHIGCFRVELLYRPFRGLVCTSTARLIDGQWVVQWRTPPMEKAVKKVLIGAAAPGDGPSRLADPETKVMHVFPYLLAHLSVTRYEDGSPRRPGWFTTKTMGAQWIIQVKDPDACAQLQVGAMLLDDAFAMVELLLSSEAAPWEPDPFLKKQSQGGKK